MVVLDIRTVFASFKSHNGGSITFRDNSKGKIMGKVIVGKSPSIENVDLVKGLKHNLLSISKLCDTNKTVIFESSV